jgi:hypothetical protein
MPHYLSPLSPKESFFAENFQKICLSFAEMAYVAEELCLNALLRLEVGKCLILFIDTLIPTVSKMERLFIFRFKT